MNADKHWEKIGQGPHHGICVPLFSLRTKKSCGIGEFNDLIILIDWCRSIGLNVIQLLPLCEGIDESPYNALSSCALDPIYLSLRDLPEMNENLDAFLPLTQLSRLDRTRVKQLKLELLSRYFQKQFDSVSSDPSYETFLTYHSWVRPYALFKVYKEQNDGKSWMDWPQELRTLTAKAMDQNKKAIDFYCFLQYLCFQQIETVHRYASSQKVFLQADIPILLSPDSVDVWAHPNLFDLHLDAGAPPDYYNPLGQHWGFPLYNWDVMRAEQYRWCKQRLQVISSYSDLYRIDHVVGYFRIWAIPKGKEPREGSFFPSDPSIWAQQGKEILEMMLSASPLLPIAEDLGSIPNIVRDCLRKLGICGTKVMRWERFWNGTWNYIPYSDYEPLSVTTISTPDSETLAQWWVKYPAEATAFAKFKQWVYKPDLLFEQRKEILRDSHHTASIFHINLLQETLALFPELIWPHLEDQRINIPGTILPTNWTYRFKPFLEEIVDHVKLADAFQEILRR